LFGFGRDPAGRAASAPDDASSDLEPGQVVGEYVVERKLGEGGFGAVYRAVHPVIGKTAAVKVLHPQYSSNPDVVSRFVSEARAVNQIRHRHIIDIFSFGTLEDGRHYYVMELLEGVTLDAYLERAGRLEPVQALPILQGVARALEAAHEAGIAHRDLKPENVFLAVYDDGTVFPKILDFGVAKLLTGSGPGPIHRTHTGTPIGTPRYMSPEQCQGRKVDHRTDIYSFGVITHRMLAGKLPFEASAALELMLMHVGTPPPRLSEVVEGLDPAWDEPILRMLEKDPERRPATLSEAFQGLLRQAESLGIAQDSVRISFSPEVHSAIARARVEQRTPGGLQTPASHSHPPASSLARRQSSVALAGVLLASVLGLVAVFALRTSGQGNGQANLMATTSAPSASTAQPDPTDPAPAACVRKAAASASVAWTFQTTPPGAEVAEGERVLGRAPGPFLVPRDDAKRTVTVRAAGYEDETLEVSAASDQVVTVHLKRRVGQPVRARPDVPKDLEYPF
jgi:serine/threonine-protein kinase